MKYSVYLYLLVYISCQSVSVVTSDFLSFWIPSCYYYSPCTLYARPGYIQCIGFLLVSNGHAFEIVTIPIELKAVASLKAGPLYSGHCAASLGLYINVSVRIGLGSTFLFASLTVRVALLLYFHEGMLYVGCMDGAQHTQHRIHIPGTSCYHQNNQRAIH